MATCTIPTYTIQPNSLADTVRRVAGSILGAFYSPATKPQSYDPLERPALNYEARHVEQAREEIEMVQNKMSSLWNRCYKGLPRQDVEDSIIAGILYNEYQKTRNLSPAGMCRALKGGRVPAEVVEYILIVDPHNGPRSLAEYQAIDVGYKGKLSPEASRKLRDKILNLSDPRIRRRFQESDLAKVLAA